MRLGLNLGYAGSSIRDEVELVTEAERLGYDSVWVAESYGSDAVTVLSWIAAQTERIHVGSGILQIPARSPAMTAMTAVTLSELSGGRFRLGLGVSGPQVAEGWHGVPYGKPLTRTREFIEVVRAIVAREQPVAYQGEYYQLPYSGADASGLGIPLKLIVHPTHAIPIYVAAIGPKNVELAAEIADGWLPMFFAPQRAPEIFGPALARGFAASGEADKAKRFDLAAGARAAVTDDVAAALAAVKPTLALYIGGMGAPGRNFYNDLARRYGFEEQAQRIQDLYLAGRKDEAIAAVPDELADEVSLVGPAGRIAQRLRVWEAAGVTSLLVETRDSATLRVLADLVR